MLLEYHNNNTVIDGVLSFNTDVKFTIFKCDEKDKYSFIHISNGIDYAEHSFYDFELLKLLKAINNNDFEALEEINDSIAAAIKSFYNFTFLNDNIINRICEILNITLGEHEKELYNQDFDNTRDDLFTFKKETFLNNWFYCLKHLQLLDGCSDDDIIKLIVQYYMTVFIECCIECEYDNVADLYK